MNHQKIEAVLASVLSTAEKSDEFSVFIHTDQRILTGMFSAKAIEELSNQIWVKRISLSQKLSLKG